MGTVPKEALDGTMETVPAPVRVISKGDEK